MKRAAALIALAVLAVPVLVAGQNPPLTPVEGVKENAEEKRPTVDIPVRRVVLFTSGLGFFEHEATVEGNVKMELACRNDELNDVLKSMVTQDTDGTTGGARYALPASLDKMSRDISADMIASPGIAELLSQARGAEISISLGTTTVTGRVMGIESRVDTQATSEKKDAPPPTIAMLNLLLDKGAIRSIKLQEVTSFAFTDPKLQKGLADALEASRHPADVDHKEIEVLFDGAKKRNVRLAYTVEAPVWKMSYRLILPEIGSKEKGKLQGWAIVENDTESDWENVQLTMVGGRPLSFVENLYASYYIPRPVVQTRVIVPRDPGEIDDTGRLQLLRDRFEMYRSGRVAEGGGAGGLFGGGGGGNNNNNNNNSGAAAEAPRVGKTEEGFSRGPEEGEGSATQPGVMVAPNYAQGIKAMADVEKVGEHFQYDLGKVTVKKKHATMLPVMADPIEVERMSVFNPAVLESHAMLGVQIVNGSDHYMLSGPVTVMESAKGTSMFAGDARVADTPPGQRRWVSYAVDQDVKVKMNTPVLRETLVGATLTGNTLTGIGRQTVARTYTLENGAKEGKTVIVEKARDHADWTLDSPKPEDRTEMFNRFKVAVAAGKSSTLEVIEGLPALVKSESEKNTYLDSFGVKLLEGEPTTTTSLAAASVTGSVLNVSSKQTITRRVTMENKSAEARTIVVEVMRAGPGADLISPPAAEKTETSYRFTLQADAGKAATLSVTESLPELQHVTVAAGTQKAEDSYHVKTGLGGQVTTSSLEGATMNPSGLTVLNRLTVTRNVTMENKSKEAKSITVEVTPLNGDSELVSPTPVEKTETSYSFRLTAEPGKTGTLSVAEVQGTLQRIDASPVAEDSQHVRASMTDPRVITTMGSVKIANGMLEVTNKMSTTRTLTLENKSGQAKSIMVEALKLGGQNELVSPAAVETTDAAYRFKVEAPAGKIATLSVQEAAPLAYKFPLNKASAATVDMYIAATGTPEKVRTGLAAIRKLWKEDDALLTKLAAKQIERAETVDEETRIRANVLAAEKGSEFHAMQIKRLQETEDKLTGIIAEIKTLRDMEIGKAAEAAGVAAEMKAE